MDGYQVVFEHEVLFRDVDMLGHMNNVAFVALMEDGRVQYWKALGEGVEGFDGDKGGVFILAELTCQYLSPAFLDETLVIGVRVSTVGEKSFQFEYRMEDKKTGRLVVEGKSAQVMYDYEQQKTIPVDDQLLNRISLLEGRSPARDRVSP